MLYSSKLIRILWLISEVKQSALVNNDYENIIVYSEESEQREMQANKCGLFQIHLGGLRVSATSGKFDYFYSYLSLETVSPALKLTQNCYINVNIFFLKTCNLFLNWVPSLFSYNHLIPDRLSLQSILLNSLVNGEQIESTTWAYVKKKKRKICLFFPDLGKTEKSLQSNLQKFENLFVNCEKLGSSAKD